MNSASVLLSSRHRQSLVNVYFFELIHKQTCDRSISHRIGLQVFAFVESLKPPLNFLPLLKTPTRQASILSAVSLMIEILTGTHVGSMKLSTSDFALITSTRIVVLKFLKHGCPSSKCTKTGKWYNSRLLREQLLTGTVDQWED